METISCQREVQNNGPSMGEYGHFLELQISPTNKAPEFFKRLTQHSMTANVFELTNVELSYKTNKNNRLEIHKHSFSLIWCKTVVMRYRIV